MEQDAVYEILLIEDNDGDAFLANKAFEMAEIPINLRVVESGDKALVHLRGIVESDRDVLPELILLDLNLPGRSGLDTLKAIKTDKDLRRVPVVVLSSSRAESDVSACYDSCANGYVIKPHSVKQFADMAHAIESFWFNTALLPKA